MTQPMNRAQKRYLQRQGSLTAEGTPAVQEPRTRAPKQADKRLTPAQYLREVNAELRKVAWPSRTETVNYSVVVLICLVLLIAGIFVLDYASSKFVLFLFK
jgi:preprotein translocase subunit SecE